MFAQHNRSAPRIGRATSVLSKSFAVSGALAVAVTLASTAFLAGCSTAQPTKISGSRDLPANWLKLSDGDWRVRALPEPTREYLVRVKENMAQEQQSSYYRFYGRYSDGLIKAMSDANEAATNAFLASPKMVNANLTPELYGTSETYNDVNWHFAANANQEWREMKDDWGRFWLTDKPSSLSPYPIQATGGQP
jgi:hypothetical protein